MNKISTFLGTFLHTLRCVETLLSRTSIGSSNWAATVDLHACGPLGSVQLSAHPAIRHAL